MNTRLMGRLTKLERAAATVAAMDPRPTPGQRRREYRRLIESDPEALAAMNTLADRMARFFPLGQEARFYADPEAIRLQAIIEQRLEAIGAGGFLRGERACA